MKSDRPRILFIYKDFSHFVKKDYESLGRSFQVVPIRSPFGKSGADFFFAGAKQFFLLARHIWKCDALFCWFADYHSLLPALFSRLSSKPLFLVLGGYDVTHVESLDYGSFNKKFRGFCARYSMRHARMNLPVAEALGIEARKRAGDIHVTVLPTGYDPALYLPGEAKEEMILTVSITDSRQRYLLKGIDRFVELAGCLPELRFVVIGIEPGVESQIGFIPGNLVVLPPLDHADLVGWYGKARYYAQFSRSEGLPNAVCEAMLRNCIPLGIRVGGIPEAMGSVGILLDAWDAEQMAEKVRSLPDVASHSQWAREHILQHFQIDRREQALEKLIR